MSANAVVPGPRGDTGAAGTTGAAGPPGAAGPGVPAGGTGGQVAAKADGTDYNVSWHTPVKADVGLGNVENTALSTWAGSTNLATLGTITAGTWHGTAVGATYIADLSGTYSPLTGSSSLVTVGTITAGTWHGTAVGASYIADLSGTYATAGQGVKADSAVQSVTLNTSNTLHATPVTFTVTGGAAAGTLTLNTQTANLVLAGPTTGAAAAPGFRALVTADVPAALPAASTMATSLTAPALYGSAASGGTLTVSSSSHATKGALTLTGSSVNLMGTSFQCDGTYFYFTSLRAGSNKVVINGAAGYVNVSSDGQVQFDTTTGWSSTDVALKRYGTNALKVNNGSTGVGILTGVLAGWVKALGTVAGTASIDPALGNVHTLTTTASTNLTLTPASAGTAGQKVTLVITSDATGGDVVTFASAFKPSGTLTLTASKVHTIEFVSDGSNLYELYRTSGL